MSSSLGCILCLDPISEAIWNSADSDSKKRGLHVYIIIQKLFGISLDTSQSSQICLDCDRVLLECYMFYEKVSRAQPELFKIEDSILITANNIKTEVIGVEPTQKEEDIEEGIEADDIDYDVKDELHDGSFSDEDDIALHQYIRKLQKETIDKKPGKKTKKIKSCKKLEQRKKKPKVKKDLEVSDPTNLIDDNGIFIVKGPQLEALLSNFFILTCDVCEMKHLSIKELFQHYEKQHNIRGYVTCCGIKLEIYRKIKFHMAMHVQPTAFNCGVCNKSVTRPAALKYHMLTHLPMAQKPLQCDECGKGFVHRYHLSKHKLLHLPMDQRPFFQCKFCDKTFTVQNTYSAHMSIMHRAPKYLCPHCGKSIRDKMQFDNHMKRHDPESVRHSERVKCDICGVVLAHKLGLQTHMRRHENKFPCPHCNYVTRRNVELKKHIQVRHTDIKPFSCVICKKEFKLKHSMKIHMAQHTGERNYKCSFCPRTFVDPGNCYSHKKKMHPLELRSESELKKLQPRTYSLEPLKNDEIPTVQEEQIIMEKLTSTI